MSPGKKKSDPALDIEEVLRALPYFIYVIDKSGKLVYANEKLLAVLGLSAIEDMQGSLYDYFEKHLNWIARRAQLLRQTDQEALALGEAQYEVREPPITDTRGLTFFYQATRVPSKHLPGQLIVCLVDVTPQRMLEIQLESTVIGEREKLPQRPYPPTIHRDSAKAPRVLLIEDNPIAQQSTKALLNNLQCVVDVVETEQTLTDVFALGKYDFVLMDIGLEGTTGYLLSKKIRQIETNSGYYVPIIALTSFDADMVKIDCDYYSMEGALTKPLMIDQARQMIQRYVYQVPVMIQGLKSLRFQTPL